jgi:hypothetical protein
MTLSFKKGGRRIVNYFLKKTLIVSIVLLSLIGMAFAGTVGDINGDGDVGLEEAIHALQVMSGLQSEITVEECITCPAPGILNGTRWCDQGDGTVKDMTTRLVWLKDASWGGQKPWREEGDLTHNDDAHTRAGLLKAGATGADLSDGSVEGDWRLPTKTELYNLAHGTEAVRSGSPQAFTGVQSSWYWSSTTSADYTSNAWLVHMYYGYVDYGFKSYLFDVWPVRSDN